MQRVIYFRFRFKLLIISALTINWDANVAATGSPTGSAIVQCFFHWNRNPFIQGVLISLILDVICTINIRM